MPCLYVEEGANIADYGEGILAGEDTVEGGKEPGTHFTDDISSPCIEPW